VHVAARRPHCALLLLSLHSPPPPDPIPHGEGGAGAAAQGQAPHAAEGVMQVLWVALDAAPSLPALQLQLQLQRLRLPRELMPLARVYSMAAALPVACVVVSGGGGGGHDGSEGHTHVALSVTGQAFLTLVPLPAAYCYHHRRAADVLSPAGPLLPPVEYRREPPGCLTTPGPGRGWCVKLPAHTRLKSVAPAPCLAGSLLLQDATPWRCDENNTPTLRIHRP
jgi:hypothetical protein